MVWRTVSRDRGQCGGKYGRVSGFAPMVIMYITLFMFSMVHIETYIKSLLIVVKTI